MTVAVYVAGFGLLLIAVGTVMAYSLAAGIVTLGMTLLIVGTIAAIIIAVNKGYL